MKHPGWSIASVAAAAVAVAAAFAAIPSSEAAVVGTPSPLVSKASGRCLTVEGNVVGNGPRTVVFDCNNKDNQKWTVTTAGELRVWSGSNVKCLSLAGSGWGTHPTTQACTGGQEQKFTVEADGHIKGVPSGLCLDVSGGGNSPNNTAVVSWGCSVTAAHQIWTQGSPPSGGSTNLDDPRKKDVAMQLVSSAENSSLDWKAQYSYIEDIGDGRGYTAGIIGFCSGTGDMLEVADLYTQRKPGNVLAKYLPALRQVDGSDSHAGLDPNFPADWRTAATDTTFQQAQNDERDRVYFNPSITQGKNDKLRALGQFAYYDAAVMHGYDGFSSIRKRALARAKSPAQGGDETTYLNAFLDERVIEMQKEEAHSDTSRVDTAQRVFLRNGNLDLNTPLSWAVYGDRFQILR